MIGVERRDQVLSRRGSIGQTGSEAQADVDGQSRAAADVARPQQHRSRRGELPLRGGAARSRSAAQKARASGRLAPWRLGGLCRLRVRLERLDPVGRRAGLQAETKQPENELPAFHQPVICHVTCEPQAGFLDAVPRTTVVAPGFHEHARESLLRGDPAQAANGKLIDATAAELRRGVTRGDLDLPGAQP